MALFPDAVTTRGARHLQELMKLKEQGHLDVILFVIQRADGNHFAPADNIDPGYGKTLREAYSKGVELLSYRAIVTPEEIKLDQKLKYFL